MHTLGVGSIGLQCSAPPFSPRLQGRDLRPKVACWVVFQAKGVAVGVSLCDVHPQGVLFLGRSVGKQRTDVSWVVFLERGGC